MRRNNLIRAKWVNVALLAFASATGQDVRVERDDVVCDFLADLRHYCDRYGLDFDDLSERAAGHYTTEQTRHDDPPITLSHAEMP